MVPLRSFLAGSCCIIDHSVVPTVNYVDELQGIPPIVSHWRVNVFMFVSVLYLGSG